MYNFQFFMPTKVLFGAGQLKNLHLERMPGRKALIATSNGSSTKKYGYLESVEKELDAAGVEHVLFDEIRPNPTNHNVMDGASKTRENDCDFVVALGGGSVMDCAKCIALMMSVPPKFTAYQGMDAFFHAAESVINKNEHPMGEMFALKAIELIAANLPKAYADGQDREARSNMALANSLAGYYMLCTSQHTMEHVMGSYHDSLPHGAGLIMISHAYFDFFAERKAAEEPMMKMARALGVENPTSGKDFILALDQLIAAVGCDSLKMSDYGITRDELQKWPQHIHEVLGGDITADPLPLSDEDYLAIYEQSYK
jgi:alcohol dehydrogenase class IV